MIQSSPRSPWRGGVRGSANPVYVHDPAFWQHDEPFNCPVRAFDHADLDPAWLEGATLGFVTRIATIDKSQFNPGTFLAHRFQQRRQGVTILNVCWRDMTFDG